MSCLDELNQAFPIRNSVSQKQAFRSYVLEEVKKAGYSAAEENNDGHMNVVIGDPSKADVILTAHYDTPRRALFPNIMMPTNQVLHFLVMFAVVLPCILVAVAAALLARHLMGNGSDALTRLVMWSVYVVVYLVLIVIMFKGPANKANKNDNTSGTAAVLDILRAAGGSEKAAYILFDDEEKGKKGSKAYANAHPDVKTEKLVINMDCIGNGETFIVSIPDKAAGDKLCPILKEALETIDAKIYPSTEATMNSDQKSFDKGIGICCCYYKKGIGYYTPRIHTSKDTVASGAKVDVLTGALSEVIQASKEKRASE